MVVIISCLSLNKTEASEQPYIDVKQVWTSFIPLYVLIEFFSVIGSQLSQCCIQTCNAFIPHRNVRLFFEKVETIMKCPVSLQPIIEWYLCNQYVKSISQF